MSFTKSLLIVLAALTLSACASSSTAFPTGKYSGHDGGEDNIHWTFLVDGTFKIENLRGELVGNIGNYSIEGEQITFTGGNDDCGISEGVYKWSVSEGGGLHFETVEDECLRRRIPLIKGLSPFPN